MCKDQGWLRLLTIEVTTAILRVLTDLTRDIVLALVLSNLLSSLSLLVLQGHLNGLALFIQIDVGDVAPIER